MTGGWSKSKAPSTPALAAYLDRAAVRLPPGFKTEINLGIGAWVEQALAPLARGRALILDYGDEGDAYFGPVNASGRLRCYERHQEHRDALRAPGQQDITAFVDFGELRRAAASAGWQSDALLSQAGFLRELGLSDAVSALGRRQLDITTARQERQAIETLASMDGLGAFRVATLWRGVAGSAPDAPPTAPPGGPHWLQRSAGARAAAARPRHGRMVHAGPVGRYAARDVGRRVTTVAPDPVTAARCASWRVGCEDGVRTQ